MHQYVHVKLLTDCGRKPSLRSFVDFRKLSWSTGAKQSISTSRTCLHHHVKRNVGDRHACKTFNGGFAFRHVASLQLHTATLGCMTFVREVDALRQFLPFRVLHSRLCVRPSFRRDAGVNLEHTTYLYRHYMYCEAGNKRYCSRCSDIFI